MKRVQELFQQDLIDLFRENKPALRVEIHQTLSMQKLSIP